MPIITEVEKNVDRIRDKLVAQMEKLGAKDYQQKRKQELDLALKEIGLKPKPIGNNTFILAPTANFRK